MRLDRLSGTARGGLRRRQARRSARRRHASLFVRPSRNRYNATKDCLEVSKIFDWYSEDFERGDKGFTSVSQALGRYAGQLADDPQAYERIRSGQVEIDFLDYDWGLNDVRAKRQR